MPKDPNNAKFIVSTPLLPESVLFEGNFLACIYNLKMEDWDLGDQDKFPQLASKKCLKKVYYEEFDVTCVEPMNWVAGFGIVMLLNMLWVLHFSHTNINIIFVHQLLTQVHDGCLCLGETISITNMLIHRITLLPSQGLDLVEAFVGKL